MQPYDEILTTRVHPLFSSTGQRCLETGVTEVTLLHNTDNQENEKMRMFIESIKETGLLLKEPPQFTPNNPFYGVLMLKNQAKIRPWEIPDDE